MMNKQALTVLRELKLFGMAESYEAQALDSEYRKMSFDDRLSLMAGLEYSRRKSNRLARLIKAARFKEPNAAIEDIEYHEDRKLDKEQLLKLANVTYLQNYNNIILMGVQGMGKLGFLMLLELQRVVNFTR